jgi:KDO2-lipid IV(A) lauroyltransferase
MREALERGLWRLVFGGVGRLLPFGACRRIGRLVGVLAWRLGVRRAITLRNLALALPSVSASERERIGRESLVNLVTVFLELITLRHLSDRQLRRWFRIENDEILRSIGAEGGILLSAHYGNWELLALGSAALSGVPFSIIVKSQRDFGEIDRTRTSRGNRTIHTIRAARDATALLRSGGIVAMLADQAAVERDDLVTMFDLPTYSFAAPARMALRHRPRIVLGFAERQPDGSYLARLEEIRHDDLPDDAEGSRRLTQRYVERLEAAVRRHPEQWVWQHRKWKNTPGISYD